MLPGFRFLFAAIVLSMSVLVFGLGAAALLRAAHEEVVSTPSWRAAPETVFSQQGNADRPVLAMLSVEPPVAASKPADDVPAAPTEPATAVVAPAEPAALKPQDSAPFDPSVTPPAAEATKAPAPEQTSPPASEGAAATAEPSSAPAEAQPSGAAASVEQAVPAASAEQASAPTPTGPASPAPAAPEAVAASSKIATLGGPAVSIDPQTPAKAQSAQPRGTDRKHQRVRRATQRRRVEQHARSAVAAAAQKQADALKTQFPPVPAGGW